MAIIKLLIGILPNFQGKILPDLWKQLYHQINIDKMILINLDDLFYNLIYLPIKI